MPRNVGRLPGPRKWNVGFGLAPNGGVIDAKRGFGKAPFMTAMSRPASDNNGTHFQHPQ